MENPQVTQIFEEIADLLEMQTENPFRVRAYHRTARTIRDLPQSLVELIYAESIDPRDESLSRGSPINSTWPRS